MKPGASESEAVNVPVWSFNAATLLVRRKVHWPPSVGAKRITMRRPPSQYPGTAVVRFRGERTSARNSTLAYGAGCAAASCWLKSNTSSQGE